MLRRTLVSLAATAGFVVLAFGSGQSTQRPDASLTVPALTIGQSSTWTISLDNQTDTPFAWTTVRLHDDVAGAVTLDGVASDPSASPRALQPGKGWEIAVSGSVPPGGQQSIDLTITPKVPGKFSSKVSVCDAGGTCAADMVSATIPGQPRALRQSTVTAPETPASGAPFVLQVDVVNQGTLPDEVDSITLPTDLLDAVTLGQITPTPGSIKDAFGGKALTYEHGLQPGASLSVTIEVTPTRAGGITDAIEVCGPGGMFDCEEVSFAVTVQ